MSVLGHIGYGVDKKLITVILLSGQGRRLMALIENRPGILSVTHHHARGTGRRRQWPKGIFWTERDLLMVLVEAPQAEEIFALLFDEGALGDPHQGLIFMQEVRRGHPMMPFAI